MDRPHNIFPKQNVHIYNLQESIWQHFSPFLARISVEPIQNSHLEDRRMWLVAEKFKQESMHGMSEKSKN